MPQKKKTAKKNNNNKKRINPNKQNIVIQSIPNYSSGQFSGHQNNKSVAFAPPVQAESRTDNLVGDLVSKLIGKIETDENKQTQEYSKEIQPVNNNNNHQPVNNNNVNIYNNVSGTTTTDKKSDETPSESKIPDAISSGVKSAARSAGEDFALQAGAGIISIAGAALGTAGWRNRKAIRNSISSFPSNARNRLSSISERFRNPRSYNQFEDAVSPTVSGPPAASVAGSRRPSNASSGGDNVLDSLSQSVGITPARTRTASAARPRSNSTSSENYADIFVPNNLGEQFSNARTPARRTPALNSEQRGLLERTLRNQNIDPSNISPIRQDILRGGFTSSPRRSAVTISQNPQTNRLSDTLRSGRPSGVQQHDGVSTRSIRAETGEPHAQLRTPSRGRPRIRPFGPQTQPNRRGRPTNAELQARAMGQGQPLPVQTPTRAVTRKMGSGKKK